MSFCEACECEPCDCHSATEESEMTKYIYIHDKDKDFYYVPRANSICEARVRSSIFLKHFGDEPLIVNPQTWELLLTKFRTNFLEG